MILGVERRVHKEQHQTAFYLGRLYDRLRTLFLQLPNKVYLSGTFGATGSQNIAHGIDNGKRRIVGVDFYISDAGKTQFLPGTVNYFDSTNINLVGTNTYEYKICIWYQDAEDTGLT